MKKWNNPHQWLVEHARDARKHQPTRLMGIIRKLARALIQHLFKEEMEKDGYFDYEKD